MFDDACLSEPGHYSRSIVVEALDDICSFYKIGCCPLNIFFLCLEEKMLLILDVLFISIRANCSDFKIPLPSCDFEKSLTGTIRYPHLIRCVKLFRARIASSLLLIDPAMFLLAVLPHQPQRSANISAGRKIAGPLTSKTIKIYWETVYGSVCWIRVDNVLVHLSKVRRGCNSRDKVTALLYGKAFVVSLHMCR